MRYFGTDGIRGRGDFFDHDFLNKITNAVILLSKNRKVMIARDTRLSGERISKELCKLLIDSGIFVIDIGIMPTPILSFFTRNYLMDIGIMISASHNPPEYNGIKIFNYNGEKMTEAEELAFEELMDNESKSCLGLGTYKCINVSEEYINHMKNYFALDLSKKKILLDTANGAMSLIAPKMLESLGAKVVAINNSMTSGQINIDCGCTVMENLSSHMQDDDYDIGFSFDGDGDRVMAIYNDSVFDGDQMMRWIAIYLKEHNMLPNSTVVGTVLTNTGIQNALSTIGIDLKRTAVGDKHIAREMANGYNLGGEKSGHIICKNYQITGDGLANAMMFTKVLCEYNMVFLAKEQPQIFLDILMTKNQLEEYEKSNRIKSFLDDICKKFDGRILVRKSGTEPKLRIMVESEYEGDANCTARLIRDVIDKEISNV